MMMTPQEVQKELIALYGSNEFLDAFLPFSIRAARHNNALPQNYHEAITGTSRYMSRKLSVSGYSIWLCEGGIPEVVLDELGLSGTKVITPTESLEQKISSSLHLLWDVYEPAAQSISQWTRSIVWLDLQGTSAFSASSYHELPHCTFLTDWVWKFIPPNTLFSTDSNYALQESLYHESLHQSLCETIEFKNIFSQDNYNNVSIYIPWRDVYWPLEQALHAYFVYFNISRMRTHVVNNKKILQDQIDVLEKSLSEANQSKAYLEKALLEKNDNFTAYGQELIDAISKGEVFF